MSGMLWHGRGGDRRVGKPGGESKPLVRKPRVTAALQQLLESIGERPQMPPAPLRKRGESRMREGTVPSYGAIHRGSAS